MYRLTLKVQKLVNWSIKVLILIGNAKNYFIDLYSIWVARKRKWNNITETNCHYNDLFNLIHIIYI